MALVQSRGLILEVRPYRETSRLLQVFLPNEGRISLVARGVTGPRSRSAAATQPFAIGMLRFSIKEGSSIGNLQTMELEKSYASVGGQLDRYALASYWTEVLQHVLQPRLAAPELFSLTEQMLIELDSGRHVNSPAVMELLLGLLEKIGFGSDLSQCTRCGSREAIVHVHLQRGEAVCSRCAGGEENFYPLSLQLGRTLSHLEGLNRDEPIPRALFYEFLRFLHEMILVHVEARLKSFGFLSDVFSRP